MSTTTTPQTNLINFTIDGNAITVPKGTTVYKAATQLSIDIPIFCYQDRMPPFGACRMCLVEVEKMLKLQTSCTLEATEGMVVKTQTQMAVEGRKGILELLLINHPLDCPICDRGGECPLQDQVLKFGPGQSRFYEEKRHFTKAKPLGPVLMLDRERCIVCARCTRFGDELAGDHALELLDRGFRTEVGTPGGGPAESKFIGNTIMICPVGALTSQVYRFRARPWDNFPTPTTCTLCPVGCSMVLDSRDGEIMRTRSQENKEVNDIWLCDKGWFGYEFSYSQDRLQHPLIRRNGKLEKSNWDEAISLISSKIKEVKLNGKLAGLGGNPLTTEECYLFQKYMRECAGVNHLDHRIGMPILSQEQEWVMPGMEMSIGESENLSYAVIFGLDLTEEFPVIWLRLKQAINKGAKVLFFGHYAPEIAPHLTRVILHQPGKELETLYKYLPEVAELAKGGQKGALFIGRQYLDNSERLSILSELAQFRNNTPNISLNIMEGKDNSLGARFAGMRPDIGPMGEKINQPGFNALEILENAANSGWDFLHIAGADPATQVPSKLWMEARTKLGFLVVQDIFLTETAQQADIVLPTLSYVEKGGSFINIERRIQKLLPGKEIPEHILSDSEIFKQIALRFNLSLTTDSFTDHLKTERLPYTFSQKIDRNTNGKPAFNDLSAGGLLATFAPVLFDHGIRMKHNTHLIQMAKEPFVRINVAEGIKRHIFNNDIVTIKAKEKSFSVKIMLDNKVAEGTIVIPIGFEKIPIHEFEKNLMNGLAIELIK
jgi:NADH-quinone oxidoreductase subunit G